MISTPKAPGVTEKAGSVAGLLVPFLLFGIVKYQKPCMIEGLTVIVDTKEGVQERCSAIATKLDNGHEVTSRTKYKGCYDPNTETVVTDGTWGNITHEMDHVFERRCRK